MADIYDTTTPELTDEELQRLAVAPRKLDASLNGGLAPVVQPPEPEAPKVAIASPSAVKATTRTFTPALLPTYAYPAGSAKANEADTAFKAKQTEEADIPKVSFSQPNPIAPTPQRTPISPLQQKTAEDSARLAYLQKSGSGIDQMLHPVDNNGVQIQNPHVGVGKKILAPIAKVADIAGSALLPGVMQRIPGTTEHHNLLVNQAANRVAGDYGQQKTEQEIASKEAEEEAKRTNAEMVGYDDPDTGEHYELPRSQYGKFVTALRTANAKADKANAPVIKETDEGLVIVNPNTKEVTPLTLNGNTLMPKPKPESVAAPRTVEVGNRVMQWNPKSGKYDIPVGPIPQRRGAGEGVEPPLPSATDPTSQSILAQTGLSLNAFRVLTGQTSQLPRDAATRNRASKEAQEWANKHGVDVSTLASQYKANNDVLSANISRMANTKIMENELQGTLQNIRGVANDKDLGKLKFANVLKVWAGQETNDNLAQQYAMHLYQLRNELAAYAAATQGRTGNNITVQDVAEAERTIKNGVAKGSLAGLETAVRNSTEKMSGVMQNSVDAARGSVWQLFGVGDKYRGGGIHRESPSRQTEGGGTGTTVIVPGGKTYTFPTQEAADQFRQQTGLAGPTNTPPPGAKVRDYTQVGGR